MRAIDIIIAILYLISGSCFCIAFEESKAKAVRGEGKANGWFFAAAVLLLINFTLKIMRGFWNKGSLWGLSYRQRVIIGIIAVVISAGLYIYILFFALPKGTYSREAGTSLVKTGIYGCCRHPGAYAFLLLALSLAFLGGSAELLAFAILCSALNLGYIYMQDTKYFPQYIEGYEEYKQEVPFLAFWRK